jgi:hypothetical protein
MDPHQKHEQPPTLDLHQPLSPWDGLRVLKDVPVTVAAGLLSRVPLRTLVAIGSLGGGAFATSELARAQSSGAVAGLTLIASLSVITACLITLWPQQKGTMCDHHDLSNHDGSTSS